MMALAVASLAVIVYTYLGYPLLITLLARLRPLRTTLNPSWQPTVTACIAVYNGAAFLDAKIQSLLAQDYPPEKLDILVYSDGSTDQTEALCAAWAAREPRVRMVRGEGRAGKPTGLNRMREEARGEVLLITDVRQPLNRGGVRALCLSLSDPRVGCATGNLVLQGAAGTGAYWRYEKFIRRQEGSFRGVVGMTGSIAVLRKVDLGLLPPALILDDVWIPMRLRLQGRAIVFADQAEAYDIAFEDEREFGRKVRTLAGNYQLFAWMPALLSPLHNPSWLETISHKALRLVCPWALVGLAVGTVPSATEPVPLMRVAGATLAVGQALFYLAAAAGPRLGRLGVLCRTFVVMNAAAVVGLWRFVTGRQRATW
jgi:GT2 family glycosyltransferase